MEILLDTNFILNCIKQNIDFIELSNSMFDEEIIWLLPQQVLNELEKIKENKKQKRKFRENAQISLELIQSIKPKIVKLNNNPNVDVAISQYIAKKPIILATNDKNLKKRVNNKILSIKGRRSLVLECNNS